MTMVASGPFLWPAPLLNMGTVASSSLAATSLLLDSTSDACYWVGRSPVTDTLTKVYFRTGNTPASGGDTVDMRVETVTNGRRSGSLWAANTNVTVAIADTDDNLWKTATLTAGASLTVEDEFAVVLASSAGTPQMNFTGTNPMIHDNALYPTLWHNAAGTDVYAGASASIGALEWILEFQNAGIIHVPNFSPLDGSGTLTAINSGTSPDEIALRFQLPFKARCVGAAIGLFNVAAGADFTVSLWPASSTVDGDALAQTAEDGDFAPATTQDGYFRTSLSPTTLDANTTYYLGIRGDTANSLSIGELTTAGTGEPANAMRGFPIPATGNIHRASRVWTAGSAGSWTPVTTTLPLISLILDQVDDGTGAGSSGSIFKGGIF